MKKIVLFILISIAAVSCYEDYILDYEYDAIYFPYQVNVRTFVVGEGMKVDVGAALAGVRENEKDRNVTFIFDDALITTAILNKMKTSSPVYITSSTAGVASLLRLPQTHYSISSSSTMTIKKGEHMGAVTIRPDSAAFLNDSVRTKLATYVLPFKITSADADSLVKAKSYAVIGLKFENMLFGYYWHGGTAVVNRPANPRGDTTIYYKTVIPVPDSKVWSLNTAGPTTLTTNGYFREMTGKPELKLTLKGNNVIVSAAPGSTHAFQPEGTGSFNRAKLLQNRKIFLKYKYTDLATNYTYHCTDTLTFRNRIRDGVNEWQDENPSHYGK